MSDLFGNPDDRAKIKAKSNITAQKKHQQLLNIFGKVDNKCKICDHLTTYHYGQTFFKCEIAEGRGVKSGNAGDWRKGWDACGKFASTLS